MRKSEWRLSGVIRRHALNFFFGTEENGHALMQFFGLDRKNAFVAVGGAAAGLFQAVCCCATILLANFIVSKLDSDSAII